MAVLLIAEDDPDVRSVLDRIFTRAGFTVLTAPDGLTAWQLAVAERPDVVLTDLDMPGVTGLELAQMIRRHPDLAGTPMAILSGSLRPGDPRTTEAHLCMVMLKPFTSADLVAAVRHLAETGRHDHSGPASACRLHTSAPHRRPL
jgi:CheY-like chemotaxis protein